MTGVMRERIRRGEKFLGMAQHPDPLIRAAKKARKESWTGQLEELLEQRSKWLRRQTIANNKLAEVEYDIRELARILAGEADGKGVRDDK